jgi:hypothetical protein
MWASIIVHGGVAVPALPIEFGLIEKFISGPNMLKNARTAISVIDNGDWQDFAKSLSMTDQERLDHFFGDWESPEIVIAGFRSALQTVIDTGKPMRVVGDIKSHLSVTHDVNEDYVVVLIEAPAQQ